MKIVFILLLIFMPFSVLGVEYHGETTIYEDTIWQGEVLVDGILTVAQGATLEIRPGTRISFARYDSNGDGIGESEIFAQGRFIARGMAANPIVFTSAEKTPRPGDWGALNMMMSEEDGNLLEHCLVEYGYRGFHAHFSVARLRSSTFRYNLRGAQFQESTVNISNCDFNNNFNGLQFRDSKVSIVGSRIKSNHWGLRAVYAELKLIDSLIAGNLTNGISLRDSKIEMTRSEIVANRRGVYLQQSRGSISGNQIRDNLEHGIYLEESVVDILGNQLRANGRSGLKILAGAGRVENNVFGSNGEFSFNNAGADEVNIGANWYDNKDNRPVFMDGNSREGLGLFHIAPALSQQPEVSAF